MTSLVAAPTQSIILNTLRTFLLSVLPAGVEVVQANDNQVPEPKSANYVLMNNPMFGRFSTNVDTFTDVAFIGSIAGTTLTITAVQFGIIAVGQVMFGVGLVTATFITALGTGTGGVGTYTVSAAQTLASVTLAAGSETLLQPTRVTVQLDIHGPGSSDNAQTISTLFRDDYAVQQFATSGFDIAPCYADDPRSVPFQNGEQQWEVRYVVDAVMQVNQLISGVPTQFAAALGVTIKPPAA
jgi:hypothetical protein